MNRILRGAWLGIVIGVSCAQAQTSGTFVYAGNVNDSSGNPVGSGGVVLLIVNTAGTDNGFSTLTAGSLAVNSVFDGTYRVIASTQVNDGDGPGGFDGFSTQTYSGGVAAGQQVAVVWVPGTTNLNGSLSAGQSYGLYTQNGDSSWLTPAGNGTFDQESISGNATFTAMSAVPEPSTYGLIAGTAALFYAAAWKRRPRRLI